MLAMMDLKTHIITVGGGLPHWWIAEREEAERIERRQQEEARKRAQEAIEAQAAEIARQEADRKTRRIEQLNEVSGQIEERAQAEYAALIEQQEREALEYEIERLQAEINAQYRAERERREAESRRRREEQEQELAHVILLLMEAI